MEFLPSYGTPSLAITRKKDTCAYFSLRNRQKWVKQIHSILVEEQIIDALTFVILIMLRSFTFICLRSFCR